MDMGAKKLVWKSEKMQAVFDAEQAVWTSLKSPSDPQNTEFLLTAEEFPQMDGAGARWLGTLEIGIRGNEKQQVLFTSDLQKKTKIQKDKISVEYQELPEFPALELKQEYHWSSQGIRWEIHLKNKGSRMLELTRLGIPLLMDQLFRGDDAFKYEQCVLRHTCLCHENAWIYWAKSCGAAPILLLKTMEDTALESFSVETEWVKVIPGAFEGVYTAYVYHETTPRFPETKTCRVAPGESLKKAFLIGMEKEKTEAVSWLVENGGFYLESMPGMVLPCGTRAEIRIFSRECLEVVAANAGDHTGEVTGDGNGYWKTWLELNGYGRREVQVSVNGQSSKITFFGIEAPEQIYQKQSRFICENQWETDEKDPCYHGLLMWDMDVKKRINASCNPHGPNWYAGGSDEIGLVSGHFLSEWNVYRPSEAQIRILQDYCHDFIEDRLTEQPGWRVHRMVPWFEMFEPWSGYGADDVWRAFNYVHVINTYYNMYRIAKKYPYPWLEEPEKWIYKAYQYAKAMFSFWMFPEGVGATQYGNMGEAVLALSLSKALAEEGYAEESAEIRGLVTAKAEFFAGKAYPYGSEMAYDSTAFEAVYAYGKTIGDERVMEKTMEVSLANRGWQPSWYLYMTDLRAGGDSGWNVSYMTQLGIWPVYDWTLERRHYDIVKIKEMYASYLAGFSIYNSGGYWSGEPENQGTSGWIVEGMQGDFSGISKEGTPYRKGLVAMSGEGCLGYYGALKIACSVIYKEDGKRNVLGGRLEEQNGTYRFYPEDGLGIRFFDTDRDFAVKLERDRIEYVENQGENWVLHVKNMTGDAHKLWIKARSGERGWYLIQTEHESIEKELHEKWSDMELEISGRDLRIVVTRM